MTKFVVFAIVVLTLAVFSPALHAGFINFDDDMNFVNNPFYRGLGWRELSWMLTTTIGLHWTPVTWLTLGLDYAVWGLDPRGYHFTSVLLHAATAVVFFLLARRLLASARPATPPRARDLGAAVAALLFALHPLRVESVVWVTERRDVLSGLFFVLTLLAYVRATAPTEPHAGRWRALALCAHTLALLAKSVVAPLPLLLVVLDVYPLRRLAPPGRAWVSSASRRVLNEKSPFVALSLVAGLVAVAQMAHTGAGPVWSWPARLATAAYSLWFYLVRTILPLGLVPLYELPMPFVPWTPRFAGAAVGVVAVTALVWTLRRRWPAGLAVWVSYAVLIAPMSLGLQPGHALVADRYGYLACLGFALLVGGAVSTIAGHRARSIPSRAVLGTIGVWIAALALLAWQYAGQWRDSETLWRYATTVEPRCAICHNQLGAALADGGRWVPAIVEFERAIALRPAIAVAHLNLSDALTKAGRPVEAEQRARLVVRQLPAFDAARMKLGEALIAQGKLGEGARELEEALRLNPVNAEALTYLGEVRIIAGRPREAIPLLERAVVLSPSVMQPRQALARAYRAAAESR